MYVALEGIDTCGKSTQISLLQKTYPDAIFTKEPGGSKIGIQIREMILRENNVFHQKNSLHSQNYGHYNGDNQIDHKTEFLLFLADRAEHTAKIIIPNQDKIIFSDRSIVSGIAYAKQIPQAKELNLFATNSIVPDLIIMLKINPDTLAFRLSQKSNDFIESRGIPYLLEIQNNIEATAKDLGCELVIIQAAQSKDSIHTQIKKIIDSKQ
ncbi:hypothetical protein BKH41_05455 [Helicobacter sp. 12S02232-10]|uniref:dTMP kinase n=1 Tax=Helicobacter sp. 12S02232-10 TaxID=1476197 RepID=UPI000BA4FC70|nr:dTMP kinase [Helicobacter sp. 12S02232-10]PAF48712.1 hypothetical protein BKH41_05455 [Helicobacter sp. 12S02232-10]